MPPPELSILVVVHDMQREAPRTLHSFSEGYQRGISADQYEVIVVENGSSAPLFAETVAAFDRNFRYLSLGSEARPSPAHAINVAAALATGKYLGIHVDGARLATPGMLRLARLALGADDRTVVSTLAFHLGRELQNFSLAAGYGPEAEDELLASIGWPADGYRLFEIGSLAASSAGGWLQPQAESNCVFLSRELFSELDGYCELFEAPGGGLVNLDFYRRALELPGVQLVSLLGEGTFHQVHGGVMTNRPIAEVHAMWRVYEEEHVRIRGLPFTRPTRTATLFGDLHPAAVPWLERSCRLLREP